MESITSSEVAGMVVGALLLASTLAAPKVDSFIARSQRRSLKLCEKCGGLTKIPCLKCKGRGELKLDVLPLSASFRKSQANSYEKCGHCDGKGKFDCSTCSRSMNMQKQIKNV
ncbi:hypothetical protein O6H91_19G082200 [Diphasiastrum complanatum]|uniref:Uncharacterized protein n=1 Tax=Diphasiastrum complanatum TaxID=34168 RepID=A0ACC2AX16_DIPCM|nr:hypothetical protein O6H91_19G082200 [Diphasiastrum complanatum]